MRTIFGLLVFYTAVLYVATAQGRGQPMAGNATQCVEAGYNHNNGICHPIGTPQPHTQTPQQSTDQLNDDLVTLGNLSAVGLNDQGYPIMGVECEPSGECVGSTGTPVGTVKEVAAQMLPVKPKDITTYGFHCNVICTDQQGNIIGRAPHASQ